MALKTDGIFDNSDRGKEPVEWKHVATKPEIKMSWHHTIPWNCLKAVWNGLVAGKYFDALDEYLQTVGAANIAMIISGIKASNLGDRDTLHTRLTWQGWNIVEGPEKPFRNDDPGEVFESWSGAGMSQVQKTTHQQIKILYQALKPAGDAVDTSNALSKDDAKSLERAFKAAKSFIRGKEYIAWNEGMWECVTRGQVNKQFPALWSRQPVYKKKLGL